MIAYIRVLPSEHNFLHTQQAALLAMNFDNFYYLKNGRWPDLISYIEDLVGNDNDLKKGIKENLLLITLKKSETKRLAQLLEKEDVSLSTLMPTFHHIAEMIKND